jgi:HEAT repeat protein
MGVDGKWAVPTLTNLLSHPQSQIRALAAHTLGGIGAVAKEAKSSLQKSLRDHDATVRKAAQKALHQIDAQR